MKEIIINVKGMVCGGCENRIKNVLKEMRGIEKVEADYRKGKVIIQTREDIREREIQDKLKDIGFEAKFEK